MTKLLEWESQNGISYDFEATYYGDDNAEIDGIYLSGEDVDRSHVFQLCPHIISQMMEIARDSWDLDDWLEYLADKKADSDYDLWSDEQ